MRLLNWRPDPDGVWPFVREYLKDRGTLYGAIAMPVGVLCIPSHRWLTLVTVLVSLGLVGAWAFIDYVHRQLAEEANVERALYIQELEHTLAETRRMLVQQLRRRLSDGDRTTND